jgi:hypothetical protein
MAAFQLALGGFLVKATWAKMLIGGGILSLV